MNMLSAKPSTSVVERRRRPGQGSPPARAAAAGRAAARAGRAAAPRGARRAAAPARAACRASPPSCPRCPSSPLPRCRSCRPCRRRWCRPCQCRSPPPPQPFRAIPATAPTTAANANHFAPKFFMRSLLLLKLCGQICRRACAARAHTNTSPRKSSRADRLEIRPSSARSRIVFRPGGAAITAGIADSTVPTVPRSPWVPAADHDVERRIALDHDRVARIGRGDRHLEIQADDLAPAAHADRRLAQAGHPPAGMPGRSATTGSIVVRTSSSAQPQPEADERARLGEPAVAEPPRGDAGVEFLDGQPGADLRAQRPAALGRVDDARDVHVVDAHAGGGQRQRKAIHHEARVDAGADDGDAALARARVDPPRQLRRRQVGVGEILARRDHVDAGARPPRRPRARRRRRWTRSAPARRRAPPANASAALATTVTPHAPTPATSPASRPTNAGSATDASAQPGPGLDRLQHLAPDGAQPDDRDVATAPPVPAARRRADGASFPQLGQVLAQLLEEAGDLRGRQRIEAAANALQLVAQAARALRGSCRACSRARLATASSGGAAPATSRAPSRPASARPRRAWPLSGRARVRARAQLLRSPARS